MTTHLYVDRTQALKENWDSIQRMKRPENMSDPVEHPSHYNKGKIEVIEFIEDQSLNFNRGNAIKYICRAGAKDPLKEIEDLEKARWYLKREIELIKAHTNGFSPVRPNEMDTT